MTQRIVSLVPSLTELLAKWGLGKQIVGCTTYCVEPVWIHAHATVVGGTKDVDIPRLLELRPDLVLMEKQENRLETFAALEEAGISTCVLDIKGLADCVEAYRTLGRALGCPERAEQDALALDGAIWASSHGKLEPLMSLCLIWKDPWMIAGPDTYLADLLGHAGFQVLGEAGYNRITVEEILALNPQWVVAATDPFPFKNSDFQELAAELPFAKWHILEGRALTWFLSRSLQGLNLAQSLRRRLG